MLLRIAAFELRQQLRGPVFGVVFAISASMVFGAMSIDALRVGLTEGGARDGAVAIVRTHGVWSLFYLFTTAAFVADGVLRDDSTGFAPIVRATPVSPRDYLFGRFLGGFGVCVLCFLSVPAAMLVGGAALPWAHMWALLVIVVPNLFVSSALFFGLATATRSMMGCYLGAVALLVAYGLGTGGTGAFVLVEPFGFAAYAEATRGWSQAELDARVPEVAGVLLTNRAIWVAIGAAFLLIGYAAWGARVPATMRPLREKPDVPAPASKPLPTPSRPSVRTQFAARVSLELRQIVLTPAFAILLLLGGANALATLWNAAPKTGSIAALIEAFQLVPIVVAIFFAGELMWNEKDRKVQDLVGATPVANAVLVLSKLAALALVLAGLALATAAAGASVQLLRGGSIAGISGWLLLYALPKSFDWLLVGVLALFLQAVAPTKLAGWGLMILYLIASLALEKMGWSDPFYRYGLYPGAPLPEALSGAVGTLPYRIYWGAAAVLLTVLAFASTGRGTAEPVNARLHDLPQRLRGPAGWIAAGAAFVFAASGVLLVSSPA